METTRERNEAGFSLIDVCITLSVTVIMLYALHSGTQTAMQTRRAVDTEYELHLMASDFLGRLRRVPFGHPDDGVPTPTQLDELFDADQDLGSITLSQLRVLPDADGFSFMVAGRQIQGMWRVRVTNDLNGDGDALDAREGRSDLLRVEIFYRDRLMLESVRAAEPMMTVVDTGTDYLAGLPATGSGDTTGGTAGGGTGGTTDGGTSGTTDGGTTTTDTSGTTGDTSGTGGFDTTADTVNDGGSK